MTDKSESWWMTRQSITWENPFTKDSWRGLHGSEVSLLLLLLPIKWLLKETVNASMVLCES